MKTDLLSYKHFRSGSAWIILILGILFYCFGYFYIDSTSCWREVVIKIADVLVIGVILGYLSNAAQFLGIFKQDLQDIIYGKDFVKKRKDLYPLWETLSKELFKNKFPSIHKALLNVINNYFPKDEISYYNDYERHTTIEWINKDKGIIKVTDYISFELIADSTDSFLYPIKTWTRVINDEVYQDKMIEFLVNRSCIEIEESNSVKYKDEICLEQKIKLEGSTKYEIQYTREKIYNINEDYYIGFRANYIVNKLRVYLNLPEDIEAMFICRGTQYDFEDVKTHSTKQIDKKYKGIILPRQGYVFALCKKSQN